MKNRPSRKKLIFSVTLFFSGRIWMSVYECLCIYVCVCVYVCVYMQILLFSCLWSVAENLIEVTSWVHLNYSVLFSQQIVMYLYLFQVLQSFLTYLMTVFQGRYFFFFSFGGGERGSHLVRIIAKNRQVKTKLSWDVKHISLLTCPSNQLCL